MLLTEKPPLDDDLLIHYGVLGMKWGKSRARGNGYDVRAARVRVAKSNSKIQTADRRAANIKDPVERAAAKKEVGNMRVSALKSPDRVLAARLTRSEKIVAALLLTPVGAAAAIGVTSGASRRIERKQEKGKYDQ